MSSRRDRHGRGLRGPLALPNAYARRAPLARREPADAYFSRVVGEAVARIGRACPRALEGVVIGVEEVPHLRVDWAGDQVPLAAAVERTETRPARIIVYRRPLEHRAATRRGLAILAHRIVVEQLAALTGIDADEIDPEGYGADDW
ncbi:metallopeptidase family protein [Mariniluteicoccus endophyticus]